MALISLARSSRPDIHLEQQNQSAALLEAMNIKPAFFYVFF